MACLLASREVALFGDEVQGWWGQIIVLIGWRRGLGHGRSPGHFGGLVSSLARPEAGVSRWPRGRHGVCSHADRAGPGQTCFPPRPSTHIPCRRTAAGRGRPGALQGRAAGRPPCGGCACWGPSQWAVWTGVRGGPTSGSSAREREEPAGPLPVVGEARGFQQRPEGLTTATEKAEGQGRGQARVGCGGHRRSCDCFSVRVAREGRPPLRAGLGGLTEAPAGRRTG